MNLVANKKNLKIYGPELCEKAHMPDRAFAELIRLCTTPIKKINGCHFSHSVAVRLRDINSIIGTCGVEGIDP